MAEFLVLNLILDKWLLYRGLRGENALYGDKTDAASLPFRPNGGPIKPEWGGRSGLTTLPMRPNDAPIEPLLRRRSALTASNVAPPATVVEPQGNAQRTF